MAAFLIGLVNFYYWLRLINYFFFCLETKEAKIQA